MKNLLKFELYKLVRAKSLYIFLALTIGMMLVSIGAIFIVALIDKALMEEAGAGIDAVNAMLKSNSANDIMLTSMSYSSFTFFMSIFTAIFLCDDYTQKTIKNIYSRGFTRTQVFIAKMIVIAIAMFVVYIAILISGFLFGLLFFGNVGEFHSIVLYIEQFLYILAFISFVTFITFAFKKISLSIVFAIFIPTTITTILTVIDYGITMGAAMDTEAVAESTFRISQLWFGNYEMYIYAGQTAGEMLSVLIGSILYILLFASLSWVVGRKHEL